MIRHSLILCTVLVISLSISVAYNPIYYSVLAKKHSDDNDDNSNDEQNDLLPTINTSTRDEEQNNNEENNAIPLQSLSNMGENNEGASHTKNSKYDSIRDIIDNQTKTPVEFVGNIVKKMSNGKQLHIMGEVKNNGNASINPLVITFVYYDLQNETLGNDFTNTIPAELSGQQTAPFDNIVSDFIPVDEIASIKYSIS